MKQTKSTLKDQTLIKVKEAVQDQRDLVMY